jgi:hypothetical protein
MQDSVVPLAIDQEFVPKDRSENWRVLFAPNESSGYDFLLLIENPETKVSYQIEVGIMPDGRLCGQITPDEGGKGPDALVLFDMTPEVARVSGNWGGSKLVISINDAHGPTVVDDFGPKSLTRIAAATSSR